MIGSTSRRAAAWLCVVCALIAKTAAGQSTDANDATTEEARVLYVEGRDLRRQGELEGSLEKFQAAFALHPTAITALEVGRGRALMGKLRSAVEVLESIERMPVRANESEKAEAARAEARELAAQVRARTPSLRIAVDGAGARVFVDGEAVPTDQLDHWLVDPGTHHVEATQGDRRTLEDLRVLEGEQRSVVLRFSAVPPPPDVPGASGAAVSSNPPEPSPEAAGHGPNTLAYVGFGVGGAGLLTGAVTGILTLLRASDLKKNGCVDGVCSPSAGLETAQTLGTVSTVAFVVGGAGIALGFTALALAPGPEVRKGKGVRNQSHKGAWVRPWLGVAAGGFEGEF
jgi:hypothetical protein